jgi:hypothetical protein
MAVKPTTALQPMITAINPTDAATGVIWPILSIWLNGD